jgi:hypothetical protein
MVDLCVYNSANVLVDLAESLETGLVQGRTALPGAMRHLGSRLVLRTGQDVHDSLLVTIQIFKSVSVYKCPRRLPRLRRPLPGTSR